MKLCPTCQRAYADEALNFCRADGTPLTPASEQQATLELGTPRGANEGPTELFNASGQVATSSSLTAPLGRRRRPSRSKVIDSLAVLPLANESDGAQSEYLSDGITEGIINILSQLPRLRVVPRSTVFRYKGRAADPQDVGRELGVRAVLTGRVVQVGDSLVVKTELVDVAHESQLWGEQYRRKLTDIFALQEEISQEISEKLRLKLSGDERRRLKKRFTESAEAYRLYLKGRYYMNKRTTAWIKKGVGFFHKAIDLDPAYALAYAGLADSFAFLASSTGEQPPTEFYPKAHAAALRALEIDDTLAEAHSSIGFYQLLYAYDFEAARRAFKRAIELKPAYANAHDGYGFYLKATGQHERAVRACLRARDLDPLSLFINVSVGWAYYFARDYERAAASAAKSLELEPHFSFAHCLIG
ncbi:MAG TPA: hypothetical protein VEQ42_08795, partial [Pyrinomonadaceae bacterium]|nr:hypothetical protein [Pyrinomonadaceae bacterium]